MRSIITLSVLMIMAGCRTEPQSISYGELDCDYCRMSIVDERYGAELISGKGKAFFFDALECQINYRIDHPDESWVHSLATDYLNPGTLVSTDSIFVLQSGNLPSPMGMNLSSFTTANSARSFEDGESDEIYRYDELLENWDQLKKP